MGWLRLVRPLTLYFSSAAEPHKRESILQKRPSNTYMHTNYDRATHVVTTYTARSREDVTRHGYQNAK